MMTVKNEDIDYWDQEVKWEVGKNNNIKCKYTKFEMVNDSEIDYVDDFFSLIIMAVFLAPASATLAEAIPNHISNTMLNDLGHLYKDYWVAFEIALLISIFLVWIIIGHFQFKKAVSNGEEFEGLLKKNISKEYSKVFGLDGVNQEQVADIVSELNVLRKSNNKTEYMKIVEKLIKGDEKVKEKQRVENKKRSLQEKKAKLEKIKNNPYLNGSLYSTELENLTAEFINLSSGKFSKDFEKRLTKVAKTIDDLYSMDGENKVLKDCRGELIEVTRKYNNMKSNGVLLSTSDVASYEELINTCETIINLNVTKELTGELTNSAMVSSIYLKDKYRV